jgi:hypothetical protein
MPRRSWGFPFRGFPPITCRDGLSTSLPLLASFVDTRRLRLVSQSGFHTVTPGSRAPGSSLVLRFGASAQTRLQGC